MHLQARICQELSKSEPRLSNCYRLSIVRVFAALHRVRGGAGECQASCCLAIARARASVISTGPTAAFGPGMGRVECDTAAMPIRTVIERGPKDKRSVAFALDWPGWNRGAKTAEPAVETLEAYRERYRPIADLAGLARDFDA